MSSLDAETIFRRLVEHQNFAQLCIEIYTLSSGKRAVRPAVRAQLRRWLEPYEARLPNEEFQALFQKLYIAVMRAVWQCAQQLDDQQVDASLFPGILMQSGGEWYASMKLAEPSLDEELTALAQRSTAKEGDSLFPDLPHDTNLSALTARSLMAGHSLSFEMLPASHALPSAHERSDTSELPAFGPEFFEKTQGGIPWGSESEVDLRYEMQPFEDGFYLLDRLTGSVWMMRSGSMELEPCFFEQGEAIVSSWPSGLPSANRKPTSSSPSRVAIGEGEITVSFSREDASAYAFEHKESAPLSPVIMEASEEAEEAESVEGLDEIEQLKKSEGEVSVNGLGAIDAKPQLDVIDYLDMVDGLEELEGPRTAGDLDEIDPSVAALAALSRENGDASHIHQSTPTYPDQDEVSGVIDIPFELLGPPLDFAQGELPPPVLLPPEDTIDGEPPDVGAENTSDELFSDFPPHPYDGYPDPEGVIDDDALDLPPLTSSMSMSQNFGTPQAFAGQVEEQVPHYYSSEDLGAAPAGAYSQELQPTLLPNRMRPGEGASYDALHGFDPLNKEVLDSYPYPIARLYEAFLSENDPRLRLRLLMLVFIHLVKYATFPLVVQYLRHPELHDVETHQALLRIQSTRWSSWLEFLRCGVELFDGTSVPFTEDLIGAFRALETDRPAQERFLYTQRFLDPLGEERVTHLHLGLLEALVVYRDSFVHGFTPTLDQAREDLRIYEPLLRVILNEFRFIANYPLLYTFQQRKDGTYLCYPLTGANPDPSSNIVEVPPQGLPTGRPLFLMAPDEPSQSLSLFPLLVSASPRLDDSPIPSQHHAIFLFHGCSGRKMMYHNLWQVPYLTDESFPFWQDLLQRSTYPLALPQLTYTPLMRCAMQWTERQIEQLRFNQLYYPELTIPRRSIQRVLNDFFSSRSLALLVHGAPGVGKTTFMAHQAEQMLDANRPVVWLRGPHMYQADLSSVLSSALGIPVRSTFGAQTERLAQSLMPLLSPETPLVVVLDDLDLPRDDKATWDFIDQWLEQIARTSLSDRIKVIMLVESRVYHHTIAPKPFPLSHFCFFSFEDSYLSINPPSIALEIPPFFPDEMELAFHRYRNFRNGHGIAPFRPQTNWEDIPERSILRELLRHPLLLRMALATYCQQELPHSIQIDELFQQYMEHVIEEKHAPLPIPERLQFLRALLRQFYTSGTSALTRADLLDSEEGMLLRALQNAHTDSPLVQLLHLGVLQEEWQAEQCHIRFTSPLLFSFFLAREWTQQSSLDDASVLFTLHQDELLFSPLPKVYLFLWLDLLHNGQGTTLSSWLHEHVNHVGKLLEEFLISLIRIGERGWSSFIDELLVDAPPELIECLIEVADRLLISGYEEVSQSLLDSLRQASAFSLPKPLQTELLFRCARLCELQGQREKAKTMYLQAREHFEEGRSSHPMAAQTYLRLASLARQEGHIEEAQHCLEKIQAVMDFAAQPELHARVIRQQGNMAYEQGEFEVALKCYQQSLQLDESCGNLRGIAASLSNLGTVFGSRGELENALGHYRRCLHIHQQLGDRKNVATTLNNIGIIYKNQGKHEPAIGQFLQSLKLREELGLFREVVTSHNNIAILYKQLGELQKAQSHARQNLALLERLQDRAGRAQVLLLLGEMYALQNRMNEAEEAYKEAREAFRDSKVVANEAQVILSLGQLYEAKGELDLALEHYREAREYFERSQAAVELILALRAIASIYSLREQFEGATNELQHALSLAEQLNLAIDVLDIMVELAHVRLLRHDVPAARAYTDRALALSQEFELPMGRKDVMTLMTRLCIREDNTYSRLNESLQQLETQLEEIPFDTTPMRTVWAFFEAARFYQDLDQAHALNLCEQALHFLQNRYFPRRKELDALYQNLRSAPSV